MLAAQPPAPSTGTASDPGYTAPIGSSRNVAASGTSAVATGSASTSTTGNRINLVTYKHSTIKALIDPSLPVQDVIRQLCANAHLGAQEPPALFALRDDETEELIDDSNMARKIEAGANFKLCSSPTIEAVEMVDKLSSRDEKVLKMATYTLQRLIREKAFNAEFLARGGLKELLHIIKTHDVGNTLAYALTSCQNLMESTDEGWDVIDGNFISKVVYILVSQERINVCRPATAILKKLVVSGPQDAPTSTAGRVLTETEGASPVPNPSDAVPKAYRYGFEVVYQEIRGEPTFLQTLVNRLGSADTTLCLYSLSLLNSLIRNVTENLFEDFISEIERLNTPKAVARLMDSNRGGELSSSILEYQGNAARIARRRMKTPVTPTEKRHVSALSYIWLQARITDAPIDSSAAGVTSPAHSRLKWRRLGFSSETAAKEFGRVGWLGLDCLESFVRADPDLYAKIVLEQINRPEDRRCPVGRASIEVTEILADHWNIESGYTTSTTFLPFLLFFQKVHHLALRFFLRMWSESGAAASDFNRVSALVRSQVTEALRGESSKGWHDVERDFLDSEYRTVRDRQMKELETEDDFSSKASIRNLRGRLYRESYEFVRQQRIHCLLEGAWFKNASPAGGIKSHAGTAGTVGSVSSVNLARTSAIQPSGGSASGGSGKAWRFYRLSPNKKYLHYCEAAERTPIRGGLDDLPERIDLSLVTDISLQTSATLSQSDAPGRVARNGTAAKSGAAHLVFSLLRAPDVSLADLQALNQSQYSEWTDGLNMLRGEGGVVSTKETAEYIQILTEIGVKVKLLDLTGERIDVPTSIPPPTLPSTTEFFFADL